MNHAVINVFLKIQTVVQATSGALAQSIHEIRLMEDFMDNWFEEYKENRKNHHLQFEISIAWDDDDEFEHEGYYNSVNDAIKALLKYKKN